MDVSRVGFGGTPFGATSQDVIDVGRVLVEALHDLRVLREQLGPRGSLYTDNVEANKAMDDLDMAEGRLQDKLQKFMGSVNVSNLADMIRPDPTTGSFVKSTTRRPMLASTLKRQLAGAERQGQREQWNKATAAQHIPPAILHDPTGEVAQRHLRQALESSSSRSRTAGMTVRGAKGARKRREALAAAGVIEEEEAPGVGTKQAAESRHRAREAIGGAQRHAIFYKLLKSIDERTDLHEYQREAMRSAVLLGRMTGPDMLACIQMPKVFEKMAMRYYKDATGFESDSSEEEGDKNPISFHPGRVSTVNIDFEPEGLPPIATGGARTSAGGSIPSSPKRGGATSPSALRDRERAAVQGGEAYYGHGEAGEGVLAGAAASLGGNLEGPGDAAARLNALPPHMRELRDAGKRRRFSILSNDGTGAFPAAGGRRGSVSIPTHLLNAATSQILRGDAGGGLDSGSATPNPLGMQKMLREGEGMVMHAPTLTRREPPSKATYNIPEVVLKRRLVLEQSMQREVRRLEEEMIKGAAESKILHVDKGELRDDVGLQFFHRENHTRWKQLVVLLLELEEWARRVGVKHACIDSQLLLKVAEKSIFKGRAPSADDLLVCVSNLEEIERELKIPGWRFRGENGLNLAAVWIQKAFRGFLVRRAIRLWNQAASFIQKYFRLANIRKKTQQLIDEIRARRQAAFERIQSKFRQEWQSWVNANHVIIHLPSVTFKREELRLGWEHLEARENSQMARLCDLMDPNADVVYVSPFPISEEVDTYWNKILQVGGVDRSGLRYRVICPENYSRLPETFSLCKKLLLSPKALLRIKMFVGSRPAFIIPGKLGREEIDLAVALGIPLFAPQPKVADRFSRKTKIREFLANTKVNMPPGIEIQTGIMRPRGHAVEAQIAEEDAGADAASPSPPPALVRRPSGITFQPIRIGSPSDADADVEAEQEPADPDLRRASPVPTRAESSTSLASHAAADAADAPEGLGDRKRSRLSRMTSGVPSTVPSVPPESRRASVSISIPGMGGRMIAGKLGAANAAHARRSNGAPRRSASRRISEDTHAHHDDPRDDLRARYPMMQGSTIVAYELAMLIVQHVSVERWIFKLDDESNGRGFAYIDVGSNDVLQRTLNRIHFDPVAAAQRSIDMYAVRTVAEALDLLLPKHAVIGCPELFSTWEEFSEAFARRGGVVEASASLIVGSPYASLVILPNGEVRVIATHELIFCPAYRTIGSYFPQSSVPNGALSDAASAVATSLFREGVIGHVGVSFIATRDSGMLRLWVIDVDIGIRLASNGFRLFDYLAAGEFDPRSGAYYIADDVDIDTGMGAEEGEEEEDPQNVLNRNHPLFDQEALNLQKRFYVTIDLLDVRGLSSMPYAEFFSRCRAQGICYDMGQRVGAAFNVVDAFSTGIIGVITVGKTPYDAFAEMRNVLDFVAATSRSLKKKGPPATISRRTWAIAHGSTPKDVEEEARLELQFQQVQSVFKFLAERVAADM